MYRERLRFATGKESGYSGTSEGDYSDKNNAALVTTYIAPTKKHKHGLMVVEASGIPLYIGESPEFDPRCPDDSWHPYTECTYLTAPLRRHGISLLENLVPLQRRLNAIDSLIILSRMTNAAPQWLDPVGSGIPEGYHSGRPGLVYKYRPVGANGAMPQRLPGIDLPPGVSQSRSRRKFRKALLKQDI